MLDEQLRFYARRSTYAHKAMRPPQDLVYSHTQKNELCKDLLTLFVVPNTQASKQYTVLHHGSYCALVHLSCELLCEILSQRPYQDWDTTLQSLTNTQAPAQPHPQHSEAQEVFLQLYEKTLSKQRRACLMLPLQIVSTIIHTLHINN